MAATESTPRPHAEARCNLCVRRRQLSQASSHLFFHVIYWLRGAARGFLFLIVCFSDRSEAANTAASARSYGASAHCSPGGARQRRRGCTAKQKKARGRQRGRLQADKRARKRKQA